jgi:hypothetical protein
VRRRGGALVGTIAKQRRRLARREEAGLTEVVAQRRCGAMVRCGGARRCPRRREGRRRLQLALGAAGEDERGEGGSKTENGSGLGGSYRGGGCGGTVTAEIINASVRAAVARSLAWMRGGNRGERGREKEETSTVVSGGF